MSYQDNVRAAAAALDINAEVDAVVAEFELVERGEQANWKIAERTYRCTLEAGDVAAGRASGKIKMEDWCARIRERIGKPFASVTGYRYKAVWKKYGLSSGIERPSWTDAYNDIRGVESMDANMVSTNFKRAIAHATPEQKREAFTSLASEPEVLSDPVASTAVFKQIAHQNPAAVQTAWEDTDTNIALSNARWQAREHTVVEPMREAHEETTHIFEPQDTALARTNFFYGVQKRVEQWTQELDGIRDFLTQADDVNAITRWSTAKSLEGLIRAAKACRDMLPASYVEEQAEEVVAATPRRKKLAAS